MYDRHSGGVIMNSLEVKGLVKEYSDFRLNEVSFTIPQGYIMGFVGENGSGKTTTIKAMLNVTKRDSGTVKIFGKNIDEHELDIKQQIGYVSGEIFYPKRTIKEITKVYKRFFKNWDQIVYKKYLDMFGLNENKRIEELSKGMCMKYSISLALSHHAKLLILDEPTSGLDPVARDNLLEVFQALVEEGEVSIFYSTHITSDLEKCADYITFIQDGNILETCSKDDLLDSYRLVNGSSESLEIVKKHLVSYKENAFGFIGLIKTDKVVKHSEIKYGQPSIDEIVIYFAERKDR